MIGIYIHVPYCSVRCSYCDFYLVAGRRPDTGPFARSLCREIRTVEDALRGRKVDSVHLGGGTPSLLAPLDLERILETIRETFRLADDAEIGLEVNPEDFDLGWLRRIIDAGVNRLSLGVQSLEDDQLHLMRRPHSSAQAIAAVSAAVRSSVRSVGIDLMLGLPGQSHAGALAGLDRMIRAGVSHISLYLLELHGRTRLGRSIRLGRMIPMEDDAAATLFERAADALMQAGFEHYEVSNFARPGHRSRHNLKYWTDQEYLGFGPAAHSYLGGQRSQNPSDLATYLMHRGEGIERIEDPQPRSVRGFEALCAGLRIREGVDLDDLRRRYGPTVPSPDDPRLGELLEAGLVSIEGARLRIAERARLVSNEILERLLGPDLPGESAKAPPGVS